MKPSLRCTRRAFWKVQAAFCLALPFVAACSDIMGFQDGKPWPVEADASGDSSPSPVEAGADASRTSDSGITVPDSSGTGLDAQTDAIGAETEAGGCSLTQCGSACVDTSLDAKNCGTCGHDCTALMHIGSTTGISCAAGKCVIAQSACAQGYAHCTTNADDGCETDITAPTHCGGCTTTCPASMPLCTATGCTLSCPGALSQCGGTCSNLDSDPAHCRDCQTPCPAPPSGGTPTCTTRTCGVQCLTGFHQCGTAAQCASDTDATQCGPACASCPGTANGDPACTNGTCVLNCRAGYQLCGGSCIGSAADPAETPCLIDDQYGVFVSPSGNDQSGSGTKLSPYKTINKGMSQALALGKNVYACATVATYDEHIAVTASGIKLYGGFDCGTWSHLASTRTVVRPTTPGVVLAITGVTSFLVEDVEFGAADAVTPGDSSVAALVASSNGVRFVRARVAAGRGAAGSPGAAIGASVALDGKPATGTADCGCACTGGTPGDQQPGAVTCGNGETSAGGVGGSGAGHGPNGPGPGQNGLPGAPSTPGFGQGGGAYSNVASYTCTPNDISTGSGGRGATGSPGTAGFGARGAGTLDSTGWHPAVASRGIAGHVGQGGGGGGGGPDAACGIVGATGIGATGGGGGSGGCGGIGGNPGGPGGSSIALISYVSNITLQMSIVAAASGGNAGNGGAGQPGGQGAAGGIGGAEPSTTPAFACAGGNGGSGGPGGPGGGGAGGHSVAIMHDGIVPSLLDGTDAALQVGPAGTAGADGNGTTIGGSAGSAGQSLTVMQL